MYVCQFKHPTHEGQRGAERTAVCLSRQGGGHRDESTHGCRRSGFQAAVGLGLHEPGLVMAFFATLIGKLNLFVEGEGSRIGQL